MRVTIALRRSIIKEQFRTLALDQKLDLPSGAMREQIQDAVKGHVLGSSVLIGLFHR